MVDVLVYCRPPLYCLFTLFIRQTKKTKATLNALLLNRPSFDGLFF